MKIHASGGLIYNSNKQILLLESAKLPDTWVLPGGKLEIGENCINAFHREVLEETSLMLEYVEKIGERDYIAPSGNKYYFYDFQAKSRQKMSIKINKESKSYIWIKPKNIFKFNISNSLNNFIQTYHDLFI